MKLAQMCQLLYHPVKTIQSRREEKPRLLLPLLVFFVVLFIDFANNWILANKFLDAFPLVTDSVKKTMQFWLMQHVAQQEIQLALLLFLGTGILMCLAVLLDGVGNYRKLLEVLASSHITLLLFELLFLGFALWYTPADVFKDLKSVSKETYENYPPQKQEAFTNQSKAIVEQERDRIEFKVIRTLKHLCYFWLACLAILAMIHLANLSKGKAIVSVSGLALFYIGLQYLPNYLMKS